MITVEHVSMKFKIAGDKISSWKEYVVARIKGNLHYQELEVLKDISFEVTQGENVGIIGTNGSGKSTLLKIISGVLTPTKGKVKVEGTLVPMLELGAGFDLELTGRENVFLNGALLGYQEDFLHAHYEEIVAFAELEPFMETPIRNYSSGMLMRLAFSIATVVKPAILIVDEILSVGDEGFQRKSKERMLSLMDGGTTVLFVSHSMEQVMELCDRVIWLDQGRIKKIGASKEICMEYKENWK